MINNVKFITLSCCRDYIKSHRSASDTVLFNGAGLSCGSSPFRVQISVSDCALTEQLRQVSNINNFFFVKSRQNTLNS